MARSTYIYVAMDHCMEIVVAGTVKREVIWKTRQHNKTYPAMQVVEIRRYGDAGNDEYGTLDPKDWE